MDATYGQSVIQGQLAKKFDQESLQLAQLKGNLQAANVRLAKVESSAALAANYDKRLTKVEDDLEKNVASTGQTRTELGRIAKKDSAGNSIVSIWEQTKQSSEFKEDLRKAVSEVTPSEPPKLWGTFRIENLMPSRQYLEVNGIGYWVEPRNSIDVIVPTGSVTTRLVEYEAAKTWLPEIRTVIIDRQSL